MPIRRFSAGEYSISPPRFFRSAEALQAMASGKRCEFLGGIYLSQSTKCRPERPSSIGPFRSEWNISDAYIKNERGERVVDLKNSNLHVLNYSAPVRITLPLEELKKHIFTLPDQPDVIPYRTSYYVERWGFCMSQNQLDSLEPGNYEAVVEFHAERRQPHVCRICRQGNER